MARIPVALFGGSFDPPHVGHVLSAAYALCTQDVERVVVVPVFEHALGKRLAPYERRVEMARLAFGWLPRTEVSTLESRLGSPSRTLRTIEALEREHPEWQLRLLVGSDILGEIHQWHAHEEIQRRAPLLVLERAGAERGSAPAVLPRVSSREVRALLGAMPGTEAQLKALLPSSVLDYVRRERLYATGDGGTSSAP